MSRVLVTHARPTMILHRLPNNDSFVHCMTSKGNLKLLLTIHLGELFSFFFKKKTFGNTKITNIRHIED